MVIIKFLFFLIIVFKIFDICFKFVIILWWVSMVFLEILVVLFVYWRNVKLLLLIFGCLYLRDCFFLIVDINDVVLGRLNEGIIFLMYFIIVFII